MAAAEFLQAVFLDQFAHGAGVDHDFLRRGHAAGDGGHHALADDGLQGAGDLAADLVPLVRLEEVKNAADGLGGVGGVQGGKDEMAGVGRAHGGGKAGGVAHFADHDDVRVLAEDVFESFLEGEGVQADFALFDDGLVVFKNIFNGVFQGDDVFAAVGVDVLDHGGQRGGFAAAGRAGQQDNAAGRFGDLPQLGSKPNSSKVGTWVLT